LANCGCKEWEARAIAFLANPPTCQSSQSANLLIPQTCQPANPANPLTFQSRKSANLPTRYSREAGANLPLLSRTPPIDPEAPLAATEMVIAAL
jgi:hypothetical protein